MTRAGWAGVLALVIGLGGCGNTKITDAWTDANVEPKPVTSRCRGRIGDQLRRACPDVPDRSAAASILR